MSTDRRILNTIMITTHARTSTAATANVISVSAPGMRQVALRQKTVQNMGEDRLLRTERRCEMDEDVKLSVEQAHQKWIVKITVFGVLAVLGVIVFWSHDCNRSMSEESCVDATFNPNSFNKIECPDRRQVLSTPPGWTWVKCTCPGK